MAELQEDIHLSKTIPNNVAFDGKREVCND
jgi:hypothetical protein